MTSDRPAIHEQAPGRRARLAPVLAALCILAVAVQGHAGPAASVGDATAASAAIFARVGDTVITHQDFDNAYAQASRGKFYHGKPQEHAMAALQREVGQSLVDEALLAKEARRLRLQPDQAAIKRILDGYEERYRSSEHWKTNRARLLPGLQAKLERDSLLEQLGKQVKLVAEPSQGDIQRYWEEHKEKFTSPEQVHLRMILLKVDPSSPQAKWDGARQEGAAIVKRLRSGADFGKLAQLHSTDGSAERGGDLGYVHQGMLPEAAQQAVDKLKPGELSAPVVLLEGIAIFKLQDRKASKLNPLDAVRERARDLLVRDTGEQAWASLLARLRRDTPVKPDESRYLPLVTSAAKTGGNASPR